MNFNLSGTLNVFKILCKPSLCLPHYTASTFNDLPIPLDGALQDAGRGAKIHAVVLDKDDCFAQPHANEVYKPYQEHFEALKRAYPGRKLLIVSNTVGAVSWDRAAEQAADVEDRTGVTVLRHSVKKPGCAHEIMAYFKKHPETGVTDASQIAVIGDRLMTDVMLANTMGAWSFWIRDGVVSLRSKGLFSRAERSLAGFFASRGVRALNTGSPPSR